jgi:uncharacterized protein YozE (UPF0346 family)
MGSAVEDYLDQWGDIRLALDERRRVLMELNQRWETTEKERLAYEIYIDYWLRMELFDRSVCSFVSPHSSDHLPTTTSEYRMCAANALQERLRMRARIDYHEISDEEEKHARFATCDLKFEELQRQYIAIHGQAGYDQLLAELSEGSKR